MAKRAIFIAVWALVFFFGSALLFGFAAGVFVALKLANASHVAGQTIFLIRLSGLVAPNIVGPVGLLLGVFGKLPGTRIRLNESDEITPPQLPSNRWASHE